MVDIQDKNIKFYYIRAYIQNLAIFLPILVIFYLNLGLNLTEIFFLNSINTASGAIAVIPAGMIADRIGRKKTFLLGQLILIIPFLYYVIATTFIEFFICEFFFGTGFMFLSTEVPFVSASLQYSGEGHKTKKIFANGNTFYLFSLITGNACLLFLIYFDLRLTFLITGITYVGAFVIGLTGYEEKRIDKEAINEEKSNYIYHLKKSMKYCKENKTLLYLIILAAFFTSIAWVGFWFIDPYYTTSGISITIFGWLFMITNLGESITTKLSDKIENKLKKRNTIILINLLYLIAFVGMSLVFNMFAILFVLFRQIGFGLVVPIFNSYINEEVSSIEEKEEKTKNTKILSSRATTYSFFIFLNAIFFSIMSPLFGFTADFISLSFTFMIISIILVISLFLNTFILIKFKKDEKIN